MPEEEEIQSRDRDFSREDQENVNRTIKSIRAGPLMDEIG